MNLHDIPFSRSSRIAVAGPGRARPCLCPAFALPLPRIAMLSCALPSLRCARQCVALPLPCLATRRNAAHSLCNSPPRVAVATRCSAKRGFCLCIVSLRRAVALRGVAMPLLLASKPCPAFATPRRSGPFQAVAVRRLVMLYHALAQICVALPCIAIAPTCDS